MKSKSVSLQVNLLRNQRTKDKLDVVKDRKCVALEAPVRREKNVRRCRRDHSRSRPPRRTPPSWRSHLPKTVFSQAHTSLTKSTNTTNISQTCAATSRRDFFATMSKSRHSVARSGVEQVRVSIVSLQRVPGYPLMVMIGFAQEHVFARYRATRTQLLGWASGATLLVWESRLTHRLLLEEAGAISRFTSARRKAWEAADAPPAG